MKVLDFVVCEDVRQELGGKLSLMGVYPDAMVINFQQEEKWPFITRLSFYIKLDPEDAPTYPNCNFQVSREGIIRSAVPLHVDSPIPANLFVIMLNVQPFAISAPGILNFSLEFSGPGLDVNKVEFPPFDVRVGPIGVPAI
ncbi:MAG: hypothetical protein ABIW76_22640 [Fibrobacteria bacterium]